MDITKRELLIAYRKAKVDCVESRLPVRRKFLDFENHFGTRLERLFLALKEDDFERIRRLCKFGYYLVPKKAVEKQSVEDERIVDCRASKRPAEIDRYELRIMADVSVEFHILTTLWILKVGEKYDRNISAKSYAARIKRHSALESGDIGQVDELSLGLFRAYRDSYKEWFDSSFDTVKKGAKWLLYLDVESFYRHINADVLLKEAFTRRIGVSLTEAEKTFTKFVVDLLRQWAECTPSGQGLPTGMSIADVIANVFMYDIDQEFETFAAQVGGSYGRYCDDILLVGGNRSVTGFVELESEYAYAMRSAGRCPSVSFLDLSFTVKTNEIGGAKLKFNSSKSKLYLYDKGASVPSSMEEIDNGDRYSVALNSAQEASKDIILSMTFRRILSRGDTTPDIKEQGISPLRSEFANIVSDFEALGNALSSEEWEKERIAALKQIKSSYLDKVSYYELHDYFPRLLTAAGMPKMLLAPDSRSNAWSEDALVNPEWRLVVDILKAIKLNVTLDDGTSVYIDGKQIPRRLRRNIQRRLLDYVEQSFLESLLIAQRSSFDGSEMFIGQILAYSFGEKIFKFTGGKFNALPSRMDFAQHDLCRISTIELDLPRANCVKCSGVNGIDVYGPDSKKILKLLHRQYAYRGKSLPWSILFPCHEVDYGRFSSTFDEPDVYTNTADDISGVYSRVYGMPFRGAITCERAGDVLNVYVDEKIGQGRSLGRRYVGCDVKIAVVHWKARQDNESALHCYDRLRRVVEGVLTLEEPPKYLIMPELCIRSKWFWEMAKKLRCHGISFVSGIEHILLDEKYIANRVMCSLVVGKESKYARPQSVILTFDKLFPAEKEQDVLSDSGRTFKPDSLLKEGIVKIVHHNNAGTSLSFGLLICRDFTDMSLRGKMRGRIDLLIVPCWNMDIHTYSFLVEASASDLHAYVVCVNDRRYGDSRIRVPAKEPWARDVIRITGGDEDSVMIGCLRIRELRREQAKMLLGLPSKEFKPLPTGYVNNGSRLDAYKDDAEMMGEVSCES